MLIPGRLAMLQCNMTLVMVPYGASLVDAGLYIPPAESIRSTIVAIQ